MKKFLATLLAIVLIISVVPLGAFTLAVGAETYDYYTYTVENGEATITDVDTSISGDVTIPDTLGGYPVTQIFHYAFLGCSSIESISIHNGVTSIGVWAFYECTNLKVVSFGAGVRNIYWQAFNSCTSLTDVYYRGSEANKTKISIDTDNVELLNATWYYNSCIGSTIHMYDDEQDTDCNICGDARKFTDGYYIYTVENGEATIIDVDESISGDITIPNTLGGYPVTSLGHNAFYNCNNLTSITSTDNITSIAYDTFYNCYALIKVTIGPNVNPTNIYYNYPNIVEFIVDETNEFYCDIDGVLFNKEKTKIIKYPKSKSNTSYVIPDSVTYIGSMAFIGCDTLVEVDIPDSVTYMDVNAFTSCNNLEKVRFSNNLKNISHYAFYGCNKLTSVIIPDSITDIGTWAFCECTSLTNVSLGTGVKDISWQVFYGCTNLTSIYYRGSKEDKAAIKIYNYNDNDNAELLNTTWYYNSCIGSTIHTYDNACDAICNLCNGIRTVSDHIFDNSKDKICNECGLVLGDASGDGVIDGKDCSSLVQYINGWYVRIEVSVADVNDDNRVNNKDYVLLVRYLNGWDVELK